MQIRFLLGPAGSGKTHQCLNEIRQALSLQPEGPPLVLLAPKQMTYELERQLLTGGSIAAYSRLNILSFERLAHFLFELFNRPIPDLLDEEGRVMVLRALLAQHRHRLKLFRASARLTGFAQQLSATVAELQRAQLGPEQLQQLAERPNQPVGLALKLRDLSFLLQQYSDWLQNRNLQDPERLLTSATQLLKQQAASGFNAGSARFSLWVDGFFEFSDHELSLLESFLPLCQSAVISLCLPSHGRICNFLDSLMLPQRSLDACRRKFSKVSGVEICEQRLPENATTSRFQRSPVLAQMERQWRGKPTLAPTEENATNNGQLRLVMCSNPAGEAEFAAREILSFVGSGGRFREVAVLARDLSRYHREVERAFSRLQIPFFLDQRRAVAHHPVVELTRCALRTVLLRWGHEDWFAALKTGFAPVDAGEIDRLENEALARGWKGSQWLNPLTIRELGSDRKNEAQLMRLQAELEAVRLRIILPFETLAWAMQQAQYRPSGAHLAAAVREFWSALRVTQKLEEWQEQGQPWKISREFTGNEHETVWNEINRWLDNVELAFGADALSTRDWLPILDAGLSNLTVGVIPPALDQVLLGAVDRSRKTDMEMAVILGLNEGVFPAAPAETLLLTETDRAHLEQQNVFVGVNADRQLQRENFLSYLACTRARSRLILTCASHDAERNPLRPSPILKKVLRLCPSATLEQWVASPVPRAPAAKQLTPAIGIHESQPLSLDAKTAARLYGPVLRTSVSRMEQFAACEFKFFIHSGLRAEERQQFELDLREQGSFQHDVLALFHQLLKDENKKWRDLTAPEARARIRLAAQALQESYRHGLTQADDRNRFMTEHMVESLQNFVEVAVDWMRSQYSFDPVLVEFGFGDGDLQPPWILDLDGGHKLSLRGRIDRVDLFAPPGRPDAFCVVLDYKSSRKQLDSILIEHGLQLQLLAYLKVLDQWQSPKELFAVDKLKPAGVFYVSLRGKSVNARNRDEAMTTSAERRKLAYQHTGRFDLEVLPYLDSRGDSVTGDQFKYRRLKSGSLHRNNGEALEAPEFARLLDIVEQNLRRMGQQIYSGAAALNPYRKGAERACDRCKYQSICRIDPWTHSFRVLASKGPFNS